MGVKNEIQMNRSNSATLADDLGQMLHQVTKEKCEATTLAHAATNVKFSTRSILDLKNKVGGDGSAIILAAGPSLHRHDVAKKLKASSFKGTLIATESAMAYCLRNDVVPDVIVTLDPHPKRIVRWFGDPKLNQADLDADDYYRRQDLDPAFRVDELRLNAELLEIIDRVGPKICAAVASCASPAVVERCIESGMELFWWNPLLDDYDEADSLTQRVFELNGLPCLNTGGNVGTAAWVLAHSVLEKSEVAVVGMDFGYYGDTTFQQTQYYNELVGLLGLDRVHEAFVTMNSEHWSTEHFTDPTYYWYRNSFLEMALTAPCKTFNCTGGGTLFGPGVEVLPLEQFLSRH